MSISIRYSARFRDAVFYFSGNAPTTGGRKTITREFPGTDRRYIEDMGLLNKTFKIAAIVTTEQEKDKLIAALETPGIGQLSHPTFGLINVTAQPYTVVDNIQNLGYCSFDLTFDVSQENIYPVAKATNISFLQSKISFLDNSILANFVNKIGISNETLQTAINTVDSILTTFEKATELVDEVRQEVIAVKETVVSLVQAPIGLINSVKSIVKSVTTFMNDPLSAFDTLKGMFTFTSSKKSKPVTKKAIEQQRVEETITQAVNTLVLSTIYDTLNQIDFENNEQLENIRNQVEELYENIIDNPTDFLIEIPEEEYEPDETEEERELTESESTELQSTSVLENLQEVRQLSVDILSEKENTVARVIEVTVYNTTLDEFVFSYYGNLDYLDKIESMNDIEDRSNISGTLKVLAL